MEGIFMIRNPLRVWWYRGWRWCWRCRMRDLTPTECAFGIGYTSLGQAADEARGHLREFHNGE